MCCKIVIPSHKRADRVLTKDVVSNPILCVAESEKEEYKLYNPELEIVCHPDNIVGLIPKRNWMAKHFGELFMLDDDITAFKRNSIKEDEPSYIKDKEIVNKKVQDLFSIAKMIGVNLFGFQNIVRPVEYNAFKPLSLSKAVTGRSYGVIYNENIKWNEEMKLKEDFWISCYVKYKERKILTDGRYSFCQKDTMINPGGLSEIRNKKTEFDSIIILKQYFGDAVKVKGINSLKNPKSELNILVQFPF